jgi:hypothetical protein
MCRIKGCYAKAVSKGLCAKHLMRVRRTGDPHKTRKPGPKPSPLLAAHRGMFPDLSPRTQARQVRAFRLLRAYDPSGKVSERAIKAAGRPNGSMNASKLLKIAEQLFYGEPED